MGYSFIVVQINHSASRYRLQLSSLLLLLVGLCSISSPGHLKHAHLVHRSPTSSSRTTTQLNRSRLGSSRTSAEAEIEPEIPAVVASIAAARQSPSQPPPVVAAWITPAPHTERLVSISCIQQDDPAFTTSFGALPHLGRAPPVA
jgi:hypothetical protein